ARACAGRRPPGTVECRSSRSRSPATWVVPSRSVRDSRRTIASSTARRTASTRVTRSASLPGRRAAACSRRRRSRCPHWRRPMRESNALAAVVVAAAVTLGGCSLTPKLTMPDTPIAPAYKEQAPGTAAKPADSLPRGDWWTMFGDAELNALQQRLIGHSPDLAAALARYSQAKAFSDQLRSGLFPSLVLGADAERDRESDMKPLRGLNAPANFNSFTVGVQANYELDLWGRIRNEVAAGHYEAQASAADLESARLSLQAELADD